MIRKIRVFLWSIAFELENILYPYSAFSEEDYYIKVKNDETGENYLIIDWIKAHKEQIERLQEEMIWVKSELNRIQESIKNHDDYGQK
jgi:hypothetical protein